MSKKILITGVTGLIGRHILYELLKRKLLENYECDISVLVRSNINSNALERLRNVLCKENTPYYLHTFDEEFLLKNVELLDCDISSQFSIDKLNLSRKDCKYHIIHSAASTNLFQSKNIEKQIFENNYLGTLNLLNSFTDKCECFSFVSTVFSCGIQSGIIGNDYSLIEDSLFRNPYEEFKFKTEKEIRKICEEYNISWQILRPAITCGRLIDEPLYYTSKFDVFYGFVKFFNSIPKESAPEIRISLNPESGLNIVSADYVARVILNALEEENIEVNIAGFKTTAHKEWIPKALNKIGFGSYLLVDKEPCEKNKFEKLYYKTAGKAFSPYLNTPPYEFDTSVQRSLLPMDIPKFEENIDDLIGYALEKEFEAS